MIYQNIVTSDTTLEVLEGSIQPIMNDTDLELLIKDTERLSTDQFNNISEKEISINLFKQTIAADLFKITADDSIIFPWHEWSRIITDYPRIPRLGEYSIKNLDDNDFTRDLPLHLLFWEMKTDMDISESIISDFSSELVITGSDAVRLEYNLSNPKPNPQRQKFLQESRDIFSKNENQFES